MNSCLADLSRLIPQQYMRKGRGRVEKTEIIEMAIRHLKNLQNQECARENSCSEQYRVGYHDCLTEAAKFMLRERGEEMCYRMVAHLKEHCNEIMKGGFLGLLRRGGQRLTVLFVCIFLIAGEMMKSRCGSEIPNGGSPVYLHPGPLSQLRDMLSCPSDIEHSSNDHHDVKDLSFRSNTNSSSSNPPQAAVITSTAPNSVQHLDTSSNHSTVDFEASSPSRISTSSTNGQLQHLSQDTNNNINAQHESVLRTIRMRKFSETSPEHEHSHNSYKFKNYIQQRFSQDTHGHENGHLSEMAHSPSSVHEDHPMSEVPPPSAICKGLVNGLGPKSRTDSATGQTNGSDEPLSLKRKISSAEQSSPGPQAVRDDREDTKNGLTDIKSEHVARSVYASYAVPVFACHTQGFYIPLNVNYDSLLPYLNGIDLFGKSYRQMPPLHPISISVNYAPASLIKAGAVNGLTPAGKSTLVETMVNGC